MLVNKGPFSSVQPEHTCQCRCICHSWHHHKYNHTSSHRARFDLGCTYFLCKHTLKMFRKKSSKSCSVIEIFRITLWADGNVNFRQGIHRTNSRFASGQDLWPIHVNTSKDRDPLRRVSLYFRFCFLYKIIN